MANYPFTSAKVVLSRVIRALGYKLPSSYIDDVLEWIPEGIGLLEVTSSMVVLETGDQGCPGELVVRNHCVQLPCGFRGVISISDHCGRRISSSRDVGNPAQADARLRLARMSTFSVNPYIHQTVDGLPTDEPAPHIPIFGEDIESTSNNNQILDIVGQFYEIVGNRIQTSFEDGYIKLRYWATPTCNEGYPLIPDNENLKMALEWHIIRRLIGSGYQHSVFSYRDADEQFGVYAARAVGEISYPSPDKMAATSRNLVRLIPPDRFTEDFFINN